MVWTNQKPTRQGWYWFREARNCLPVAVEVKKWRLDARLRESLYMFYRPNDPEETGVFLLDDVSAGEWFGPIRPGDPSQAAAVVERIVEKPSPPIIVEKVIEKSAEPVVVEKIIEKPPETIVIEKIVERAVEPVVIEKIIERTAEPVIVEKIVEIPAEPIIVEKIVEKLVPSEAGPNGSPAQARAIIEWFIMIGTDHFPNEVQGEYVVKLANMLAESMKLDRKFEAVTDVVKFLMENGGSH